MKSSEYRGSGSLRIHAAHAILITIVIFCLASHLFGQSRSAAEVRGTVLDQQGAAIADATVTLTNVLTGVSYKFTTNNAGLYDAPAVSLGKYNISFEKAGFERFEQNGFSLDIEVITINATLKVGSIHETMTVTGEASMVETDSPQGTTTISGTAVQDTVNIGHNYTYLFQLMPGVSPGGSGTNIALGSAMNASVNGEGMYQMNYQVDGIHNSGTDTPNQGGGGDPLDSVEEVKILTSNFGAEYGSGLAVVNVVTKSGTNAWHGSLYEYTQTDKWNALIYNPYAPKVLSPNHWDMFGLTLGGPIVRNKAFFYVAMQRNPSEGAWWGPQNVPTDAMRNGDFSALTLGGASPIYDPTTTVPYSSSNPICPAPATPPATNPAYCNAPFSYNGTLNVINPARIDPVAKALMSYLPEPTPNFTPPPGSPAGSGNYFGLFSNPSHSDLYNFRVDYDINPANRLTAAFKYGESGSISPAFPAFGNGLWHYSGEVVNLGDVWTFSPSVVGEFRLSAYPGVGWEKGSTDGKGYPALLNMPYLAANQFPWITIEGISGFCSGCNAQSGVGTYPGEDSVDNESGLILNGKVTWVKGKHILKFGSELDRWYDDSGWPSVSAGQFDFSGLFTQNIASPPGTGLGWADFLLGIPDYWFHDAVPTVGGRMINLGTFAQDEYKIRPNLTLTLGVRWTIQGGWSEVDNRLANFDPTLTNIPYTSTITGQTSPQTLGGMWYAPQDGRRTDENSRYAVFDPHVGFAWVPFKNWSIRGGYGIMNQAWSGANYFPGSFRGFGWGGSETLSTSNPVAPFMTLSPQTNGLVAPVGCSPCQVGSPPVGTLPAADRTVSAFNVNNTLQNDPNIFYAPWNLPMSYVEQYRLDIEHEIKGGILIDVAYVGNSGHHYVSQVAASGLVDTNQIPQALLGKTFTDKNGNTISCIPTADLQLCRPYPQYDEIVTALPAYFGNYNGLQASFRKQFTNGLSFLANYTWSHSMDSMTVAQGTAGMLGGAGAWQNVYDPRADYGASSTDQRQVLNGNVVYILPFGKGKPLLNKGGPLNYVVGGWELSSLFMLHTGIPQSLNTVGTNFSYSDPSTGGPSAPTWRPNQVGNPNQGECPSVESDGTLGPPYYPVHTIQCWYNWTAFQPPAPYTFGNAHRNTIYGPGYKQVDMSLLKNINIREKVNVKLKLEAFDAFNFGNWNPPNTTIYYPGQWVQGQYLIQSKMISRTVQVGADVSF